MRAAIIDGRALHGEMTRLGLSRPTLIAERDQYRTLLAQVTPGGTYVVRRLGILSNRFQIGTSQARPEAGTVLTILHTVDTATRATVTVSQPWLAIYLSNTGEDPQVWIERIA